MPLIEKIVSGGQTGADRMGLDWAIWHDIPHGGWCPRFRKAEDGKIPDQYQLTETPKSDYVQRTEWNVRDSDGTLIFSLSDKLSGVWDSMDGQRLRYGCKSRLQTVTRSPVRN